MGDMHPLRLGALASGGGTNLQAIIDRSEAGTLHAKVVVVIGNNSEAGVFDRARRHGIPAIHLSRATHDDEGDLDLAIRDALRAHGVEWIILAGYMRPIGRMVLEEYRDRILNIHPALLPKFGGKGMYGLRVHAAVLAAGENETGVTVHLVTTDYDTGPVLGQRKVPVLSGDTPETLQKRVLEQEHRLYAEVIEAIASGDLKIDAGRPSRRIA